MTIALVDPSIYTNDVNNPTDGEKLRTDLLNIIAEVNAQESDISDILTAALSIAGQKTFTAKAIFEKGITLTPDTTLTIASGSVTTTGSMHKIDTEAAASSDDLDTIVGSTTGTLLLVTIANASRSVVIRNNGGGSGNIRTGNGASLTLSSTRHYAILYYHGGDALWYVAAANVAASTVPVRYKAGRHPVYTSASTVTLRSGYSIMDSTDSTVLTLTADQAVALSSSGPNGLDTGSEASNTWYYLYVISDGSNVRGLWSVTNESVTGSITPPSGYTLKAQTPYMWRNDGSSNLIKGRYVGSLDSPTFWYNQGYRGEGQTGTASTTEILTNGSATTFTAVSAASFIPPASLFGYFYNSSAGSQNGVGIRPTGESHNGIEMSATNSGAGPVAPCETNSSQSIDYRRVDGAAANAWIAVAGFEVTEIP